MTIGAYLCKKTSGKNTRHSGKNPRGSIFQKVKSTVDRLKDVGKHFGDISENMIIPPLFNHKMALEIHDGSSTLRNLRWQPHFMKRLLRSNIPYVTWAKI